MGVLNKRTNYAELPPDLVAISFSMHELHLTHTFGTSLIQESDLGN